MWLRFSRAVSERHPSRLCRTRTHLAFSGPYGPSDGLGLLNAELILRSCRADGVLLKPSAPLATLDAAFLGDAFEAARGPAHVWGTYAQIGALRWLYVLSVQTEADVPLTLSGMDATPGHEYRLFDFWGNNGSRPTAVRRVAAGGGWTAPKTPPPLSKLSDAGTYQVLAPVLPSGWCLLGEAGKIVGAAPRRVASVSAPRGSSGLSVELRAASAEADVSLWVLAPGTSEVIEVECDAAPTCAGVDCDSRLMLRCARGGQCRCAA